MPKNKVRDLTVGAMLGAIYAVLTMVLPIPQYAGVQVRLAEALMVLPFLQGMGGTPDVDPNATGLVAGLTTNTTLADLYRAILEGLCYEMQYNLEQLSKGDVL